MAQSGFDLRAAAHREMLAEGFQPDFSPAVDQQVQALQARETKGVAPAADPAVRDMRRLLWSSIDNDTSRDLDQAEVAERVTGGIQIRIAIADVDSAVPIDSPI